MVDRKQLSDHIADYNRVTGKQVTKFICPVLDREIDDADLIDGHILPEALEHVAKTTVIQYKRIDCHYGGQVESAFVNFINSSFMTPFQRMSVCRNLFVRFADGTEIEAFIPAPGTANNFPGLIWPMEDGTLTLSLRTTRDNPIFKSGLPHLCSWMRIDEAASGCKAAYLADFHMRGYEILNDPYRAPVRAALRDYFLANGKFEDAPAYFSRFKHVVRVLREFDGTEIPLTMPDTIRDRRLYFVCSENLRTFGAMYLFSIRNICFGVTLPYGTLEDFDWAMKVYFDYVQSETPPKCFLRPVQYEDGIWNVVGEPVASYTLTHPSQKIADGINTGLIRTPPKQK